jgi:hypothetical protein
MVPPLVVALKDTNMTVKLAAERALMHVLQIHTQPATLNVRALARVPILSRAHVLGCCRTT